MANVVEIALGGAVELFLLTVALATLYRVVGWVVALPKKQFVLTFQKGVILRDGSVEKVLDPGGYWITPKRRLILCDVRPTPFQVSAQELLTADGLAVRMSLGGEYRILDPARFVTESSDAFGAFYLDLRQGLRAGVGELSSQSFLDGQSLLPARMRELIVPKASQLGIEVMEIEIYEAVPVGWIRSA